MSWISPLEFKRETLAVFSPKPGPKPKPVAERRDTKPREVYINRVKYASIRDAAKAHGVTTPAIRNMVKRGEAMWRKP